MMDFHPRFTITPGISRALMRIEAVREAIEHLPISPAVLAALRQTARLHSTHYSTAIEGNRLTLEEVSAVLEKRVRLAGRVRDEREVLGYFAAMEQMEKWAAEKNAVTEEQIQVLHALVMAGGRSTAKPSPYRGGQNVIRDSIHNAIVYLPPEAHDVPALMRDLMHWLQAPETLALPAPIRAGVAHYQFATIHPYYDGNGRTGRLLTTLLLHISRYDLKGIYALEEYYARDLARYYAALAIGPSHNYYMGRAKSDITPWVDYFCAGLAKSCEDVRRRAEEAARAGETDHSAAMRTLDPRQRKALELFRASEQITSGDVQALFGVSQRTARNILTGWAAREFVMVANASKKGRRYVLAARYAPLL